MHDWNRDLQPPRHSLADAMRHLWILAFWGGSLWANYPSQQSVLLDAGATSIAFTDLGAAGSNYTLPVASRSPNRLRLTVTPVPVPPPAGSTYTGCSNPCNTVSIWRDWGNHYVYQEVVDSSGNPLSPPVLPGFLIVPFAGVTSAAGTWTLPLEVIGQDGFIRSVQFTMPSATYNNRRLRIRVNNSGYNQPGVGHPGTTTNLYDGKMSVKLNGGSWINLNCSTVTQIDENRWFGTQNTCSIAAATFTIMLTAAIPDGLLVTGTNTINFRFNGTDGTTSGYRILDFNFEDTTTITQLDSISVTSNVANMVAHAATTWATNDWWFVYQAPGPYGRLNDLRQVTRVDSTHATFTPCSRTVNTMLAAACTSPNQTVSPPTTLYSTGIPMTAQPVMYAVKEDIAGGTFPWEDPTAWTAPAGGNSTNGQTLFQTGALVNPGLSYLNYTLTVHCKDCHAQDGRDLKYFNYSNYVIEQRSIFHGLTHQNALDIAAYIRGNSITPPATGRPWNPPYQPGPGLDSGVVNDWSAGAGIDAQTVYGEDVYEFLAPGGSTSGWAYNASPPVNMRELPSVWQFPDWNHWLPVIHPQDYFSYLSPQFFSSVPYLNYVNFRANVTAGSCSSFTTWWTGTSAANNWFNNVSWVNFLTPAMQAPKTLGSNQAGVVKPSLYPIAFLSITALAAVKQWEAHHDLTSESCFPTLMTSIYGARPSGSYPARGIKSAMFFDHGDHKAFGILTGGLDNTVNSHNYLSNVWYLGVQGVVNMGSFRGSPDNPMDWPYTWGPGLAEVTQVGGLGGGSVGRPAGYWSIIPFIVGPQAGADNGLTGNAGDGGAIDISNLLSYRFHFSNGLRYSTAFMTSSQLNAYYAQMAGNVMTWVNAQGNVAAWQTFLTNAGQLGCDQNGHGPLNAYLGGGTPCDNVAFGLALMKHFGVSSTTYNAIATWAQLVWPIAAGANGHDFSVDTGVSVPCPLTTSADGSQWPICSNVH